MIAQSMRNRQYEEQSVGSRAPVMILAAVAVFGLAVLLMYIAVAAPQQGTAMGAIRDVMRGLGGSLSVALPLAVAWGGVLCVGAARGRSPSVFRIIADLVMFLALLAAVQVFFVGDIRENHMTPENYWWYCDLRRYGSCRHAGYGLGFERMVMYLTGISNIRDVLPHPRTVGSADF